MSAKSNTNQNNGKHKWRTFNVFVCHVYCIDIFTSFFYSLPLSQFHALFPIDLHMNIFYVLRSCAFYFTHIKSFSISVCMQMWQCVHVDIRTTHVYVRFSAKAKKRNFKNAPVHCWYGDQCWTYFIFTYVFHAYTLIGMRTCTVRLRTHFHTHANTLICWGPSYRIIQICVKDEGKRRNDRKKARIILDGGWKSNHTHTQEIIQLLGRFAQCRHCTAKRKWTRIDILWRKNSKSRISSKIIENRWIAERLAVLKAIAKSESSEWVNEWV